MNYEEKHRLARTGDVSNAAASFRLRAARESLQPRLSQKAMAEKYGVPVTTYASWETGDAYPPPDVVRHFRREHEFTFDFILYGDWQRLPGDVEERVFRAMTVIEAKLVRKPELGDRQAYADLEGESKTKRQPEGLGKASVKGREGS